MKYVKRSDNIFSDYFYYLGKENIYTLLFGHKLGKKADNKANYIYKRLLKLYGLGDK